MSKKPNNFVIGLFVIVACVLFLTGIVLFGSGSFFQKKKTAVSFFPGFIKGLKTGASVTFRGVKIGEVTDIKVQLDYRDGSTLMPVIYEIFEDKITAIGKESVPDGETMKVLIDKGMRAQLETESIVTGILAVNLDFFPDTPAKFMNALPGYREMPAVPSTFQQLSEALRELPLKDIANGINKIVTRLGDMLETDSAESIATNLSGALEELQKALKRGDQFIAHLDSQIDPLSGSANGTLKEAQAALNEIKETVASIGKVFENDTQGKQEFRSLLISLREAADQVKELADYLERNPESLIKGKK